jgi:hypothetical protein
MGALPRLIGKNGFHLDKLIIHQTCTRAAECWDLQVESEEKAEQK